MLCIGDVDVEDILSIVSKLTLDVCPEILIVDGHIIFESLSVELHPLFLYLLVSKCHVSGSDQVSIMLN